ncbi:MAG: DNA repair protein RadC [Pseudomonadales bacterium]|nr:DNA repair protein RadC [Pseudomonadales bacterium]
MTIIEWPRSERPREKLLSAGADRLSDAELLALILHTGCRGKPATVVARELLSNFGGLAALLGADQQAQFRQLGLGPTKVARLQAVRELTQRSLLDKVQASDPLTSSAATRRYLLARFRKSEHEVFSALFLNNQHHVVKFEELFRGTIDGAAVYPREVVKRCLFHNAAAVIFAHNHPSGVAEPSAADIAITSRLQKALATIDVRVLDHLVIGANEIVSLAERNQL